AKNDTLFEAGRLKIVTGVDFGNVNVIVTDCATLAYDDDGADMYRILALTAGGAKVSQVKETINSDVDTSKVNNTSSSKFELSYFIKLKGISYDGGQVAPTDVELATTTNYTRVASSVKGAAGV